MGALGFGIHNCAGTGKGSAPGAALDPHPQKNKKQRYCMIWGRRNQLPGSPYAAGLPRASVSPPTPPMSMGAGEMTLLVLLPTEDHLLLRVIPFPYL